MARTPDDPSGAKINVSLRLSPRHVAILDEAVSKTGSNRSVLVEKLIARLAPKPPEPVPGDADCAHVHKTIGAAGLGRCNDCGARRGANGLWIAPT